MFYLRVSFSYNWLFVETEQYNINVYWEMFQIVSFIPTVKEMTMSYSDFEWMSLLNSDPSDR